MTAKNVCCWDLEGPITILDFAAELGKLLREKSNLGLQNYNMAEFYKMLSAYDDYLIEVPGVKEELNIPEYQPGDTLRLIAPIYISSFTDEDLTRIANQNMGLLPGCRELMVRLHKDWDVYIISTSYSHFAYSIANSLNVPNNRVFCTDLDIKKAKETYHNIKNDVDFLLNNIFQEFLAKNKNLDAIIENLNEFFWNKEESDYLNVMNLINVRGGKRKESAVERISEQTTIPISQFVVLGDSITDINMLQRVNNEGGIAVSFNGNRFTINRANIAITTRSNLGTLPIFEKINTIESFLESWESSYDTFKNNPLKIPKALISKEAKEYFVKYNFTPDIENLRNKTKDELDSIIRKQEQMRKDVRGWSGDLG
ncbi:MAG: HAD hydrolase family protein [Candidatus Hermodarchaeota archaeon]